MHVAYSFPNRVGVPGIGMIAWHQVEGLVAAGVKVTLFCGSCEQTIPGVHRVVETMKIAGFKLPYRVLGRRRSYNLHDRAVRSAIRRNREDINILHCWPTGSLETLDEAKRLGIPSFLERPNCHTAFAFEEVEKEHELLGLPLPRDNTHFPDSRKLEREELEYALADKLLCPSDFVAGTFLSRGFKPEVITRHQYGYDPSRFTSEACLKGLRPFTVVFAGRCEPRKGLHYALEAWHASGAAECGRFIICGSFIEGYRDILRHWIEHPSIEVMGFVSNVQNIMHQADALVLPAVEEGSALVTYEARGAGCMLMISSATGALCTDGVDAMVHSPRDAAQLAEHFALLMHDRDLIDTFRQNSLNSLDKLSWAAASKRLLHCYAGIDEPGATLELASRGAT